jgi:hypothetical protein
MHVREGVRERAGKQPLRALTILAAIPDAERPRGILAFAPPRTAEFVS